MNINFIKMLLIYFFIMGILACNNLENKRTLEANALIEKIEVFKSENGRLPENLSEVGIIEKEEGPLYYDKKSENHYIIWFGTNLGESKIWDSRKNYWK